MNGLSRGIHMPAFSKDLKRQLREWSGIAYERELGTELKRLHNSFHCFCQSKMGPPR